MILTTPAARWLALAVAVLGVVGFVAYRYYVHRQHMTALEEQHSLALSDVQAYHVDSSRLLDAGRAFARKSEAAGNGWDQIANNIGELGVVREKLDALRTDHSLDDALAFVASHTPIEGSATVARDRRAVQEMESVTRDRATAVLTTVGMAISNPFLIASMPSENFYKMGYSLGYASGKTLRSVGTMIKDIDALSSRSEKRAQAITHQLDDVEARNFLGALITP